MFCFQCEQTVTGSCTQIIGNCGKDENSAVLQDVLIYITKELSSYVSELINLGIRNHKYDDFVVKSLFTTVTNVNFDADTIFDLVKEAHSLKEEAKNELKGKNSDLAEAISKLFNYNYLHIVSANFMLGFGKSHGIPDRKKIVGDEIAGVEEMVLYGIKGMAAYMHHAEVLGKSRQHILDFVHETLYFISKRNELGELLAKALEVGKYNLEVMEMLDNAHTSHLGDPVPTKVRINSIKGKAILVSGHDLKDLEELLKQTEGKGINIYTHGEMLPAHSYPELKKYPHLVANYGGAWQDQKSEFDEFPGSILMTTNCIQKPKDTYNENIFTTGLVRFPGVNHIDGRDYTKLIERALELPGFQKDEEEKTIFTGFGHNAILSVAETVINAVKSGDIKHFFLIGGCDGAKSGRNYYTEFAEKAPKDTVILTLACGKFRFNKLEFGEIGGIPRLLDMGQCNDAYSAIKVAVALAGAFNTDVNSLPLSLILSWYEQKAVAILLTLLHLGIKNIKLGPTLPSFIHPKVLDILVQNYNISGIKTAEEDLKEILG